MLSGGSSSEFQRRPADASTPCENALGVRLSASDLSPRLPRIIASTLFIAGENDIMATVAEASACNQPHGTAVSVPGFGHITPLLQSAPALAQLIIGFWAGPGKG